MNHYCFIILLPGILNSLVFQNELDDILFLKIIMKALRLTKLDGKCGSLADTLYFSLETNITGPKLFTLSVEWSVQACGSLCFETELRLC